MAKSVCIKKHLKLKAKYCKIKKERDFFKCGYYKLETKYDRKTQQCITFEKNIEDLRARLTKVEGRLAQHENPHTPSSQKPIGQKDNGSGRRDKPRKTKSGKSKKSGAQKGHVGTTSRPKPTQLKTHTPEMCPLCGTSDLEVTGTESIEITDRPPRPKAVTTQHITKTCRCLNCGNKEIRPEVHAGWDFEDSQSCAIMGRDNENKAVLPAPEKPQPKAIPSHGRYGINIVSDTFNNFLCRMPHRINAEQIARCGASMSVGTIHNILSRTSKNMGAKALEIMVSMRAADLLHVDETSMSLNGKKVWVWIFFNPYTGDTVFAIRKSRGNDVIGEVLGNGWKGTIVCDGWTAYKGYNVQRCWAHLMCEIREVVRKNPDCQEAKQMLQVISSVYKRGTDAQEMSVSQAEDEETFESRRRLYKYLRRRIRGILKIRTDCEDLQKFRTKLGNAYEDLFRFILDPRIPPTNNAAERGLREIVVHRKIRGSIRSEDTMEWLGYLFTCVATWKMHGLDPIKEIASYI